MQHADQAIQKAEKHLNAHTGHEKNYIRAACSQTATGTALACKQAKAIHQGSTAWAQQMNLGINRLERVEGERSGQQVHSVDPRPARIASIKADRSAREARHSTADFHMAAVKARNKSHCGCGSE